LKWLPDVNVLLSLAWAQHPHHQAAHSWFSQKSTDGWATSLLTQSAFLRLSLNPQIVHVALDVATARQVLAGLVAHPQHHFLANSLPLTASGFDPIAAAIRGYRQVTDAALLWQANSSGLVLVTFDQGVLATSPRSDWVEILRP
jgi:uncharacterized protein